MASECHTTTLLTATPLFKTFVAFAAPSILIVILIVILLLQPNAQQAKGDYD